jgi:hypothetical protein
VNTPNRRIITLAGLGLVGAGGVLGLALSGGAALADPSPAPASTTTSSAAPGAPGRADRADRQAELAGDLAAELGLDEAKVAAALEKVREKQAAEAKTERTAQLKARLDAAVTEGKMTREQADAVLKAAEAGVLNGPYGGPGGHHGFGGERHGR